VGEDGGARSTPESEAVEVWREFPEGWLSAVDGSKET